MTAKSTQPQLTAEDVLDVLELLGMSEARTAVAQIIAERDALRLALRDYGEGCNTAVDHIHEWTKAQFQSHFMGMQQRAAALTGTEEWA